MKKGLKIAMMFSLVSLYILFTYSFGITSSINTQTDFQNIDYIHYSINEEKTPINQPAKTENISISVGSVPVTILKNNSNNLGSGVSNEVAEFLLFNACLGYIHISEFISHRLLSFNIVFPFHYFW